MKEAYGDAVSVCVCARAWLWVFSVIRFSQRLFKASFFWGPWRTGRGPGALEVGTGVNEQL